MPGSWLQPRSDDIENSAKIKECRGKRQVVVLILRGSRVGKGTGSQS